MLKGLSMHTSTAFEIRFQSLFFMKAARWPFPATVAARSIWMGWARRPETTTCLRGA